MSRKLPSSMKWQQYAVLETSSPYGVLNCMRYDRACPCTEEDAGILERFLSGVGTYYRIKIVLTRWSEDRRSAWTADIWKGSQQQLTPIEYNNENLSREIEFMCT